MNIAKTQGKTWTRLLTQKNNPYLTLTGSFGVSTFILSIMEILNVFCRHHTVVGEMRFWGVNMESLWCPWYHKSMTGNTPLWTPLSSTLMSVTQSSSQSWNRCQFVTSEKRCKDTKEHDKERPIWYLSDMPWTPYMLHCIGETWESICILFHFSNESSLYLRGFEDKVY